MRAIVFLRGIRGQLLLLILVLLGSVLLGEVLTYHRQYADRKAEELQANLELARAVGKTFETFVQQMVRAQLPVGLALTAALPPTEGERNRLLDQFWADNPAVRSVYWVDASGRITAASQRIRDFVGTNIADRSYIRDILAGRPWAVSDLYVGRATGQPGVAVSRGIRDAQGTLRGIVVAAIDPELLNTVVGVDRARDAGLSLIDRAGMHVYRNPPTEYTMEERNWLKLYPVIEGALKGQDVLTQVTSAETGKARLVAFAPVPSLGWVAAASRAEDEVLQGIHTTLLWQGAAVLAMTVLGAGMAGALARSMANGIGLLRRQAQAVERGDVERVARPAGPTELVDLATVFNQMATAVRTRETALRESEARFRALFETANDAIVVTDPRGPGRVLAANPAACRLFGYTADEFAGLDRATLLDLADPAVQALMAARATTGHGTAELTYCRKDGSRFTGELTAAMLPDAAGHPQAVAIIRDITARKQADTALRESERFVSSVAAASPHLIYVFDLERMGVTYVSRSFLGELGYPMETAERVTRLEAFRDYMEPEEMPHLSRLLDEWRTLPEGHLRQDEYRLRHADGTLRSFAGRELAFARRPDGSVWQIIGSLVDITARKQAEEALREAHATLEQRVQERTAALAHALEKLSVQAAQLRSLASELTLVEQRERVRLATQIHDGLQQLLVAARLRAENLVGRAEDAAVRRSGQEISGLLGDALADARSLTAELSPPILRTGGLRAGLDWLARWSQEKHHFAVHVQAPAAPLPPLPEDLTVLLFQAVRELLFNAVKYAQVLAATVTLAWDARGLTLTVADAGVGFDPRGLRGEGGSGGGFGLASIRHRLELLGGCMTIAARPARAPRSPWRCCFPREASPPRPLHSPRRRPLRRPRWPRPPGARGRFGFSSSTITRSSGRRSRSSSAPRRTSRWWARRARAPRRWPWPASWCPMWSSWTSTCPR